VRRVEALDASPEEGADAGPLIDALKQQEADLHSLATRYLTDPQLAELGRVTEGWYRAHPDLRYVSHVHLAGLPVPNAPPARPEEAPGSVFALLFKPSPKLDPAVHEVELSRATSERMFFYLQRLPMLLAEEGREVKAYLDMHRTTGRGIAGRDEALVLAKESAEPASTLNGLAGRTGEPWHKTGAGGCLRASNACLPAPQCLGSPRW